MSISLTPSAAERVRSHLASRGRGLGLRLGIKTTGCSGYSYVVDYADTAGPADPIFQDQGGRGVGDRAGLSILHGTRGGFLRQGLSGSLPFPDPHNKGEWRCGGGFTALKSL